MVLRVRFAPSPSGYLHIGGVRTALFNWLWARRHGGRFVLRVEDTDQERSSLESVRAQLDALTWLGLSWDEGPEVGGDFGPYFQSERKALYREAAERLVADKKAFRCYCTKEELDAQRKALKAENPKAQFAYPGTCRERSDEPDRPFVVRFKTPRDGSTDFVDKVFGPVSTPNREQQDFVLLRSDGFPLYNLACVVDDHAMGLTLVGRGRDHLGNTPPQLLLYQAFGWTPPEFAHLPMILSPSGEKLSKRHAAVSVQDYRDRGYTPGAVLNYLVRFGWSYGDREIFSVDELRTLFDWERTSKSDGKFDEKKFADVAFEHLKRPELTKTAEYCRRLRPFLEARGLFDVPEDTLARAVATIRERARTLVDAAFAVDYYFRDPPEPDEKAFAKFLVPEAAAILLGVRAALAQVESWEHPALEAAFDGYVANQGLELKSVAQPVRVALTGRSASPPLFDVMAVLGKRRSLERLEWAAGVAARDR